MEGRRRELGRERLTDRREAELGEGEEEQDQHQPEQRGAVRSSAREGQEQQERHAHEDRAKRELHRRRGLTVPQPGPQRREHPGEDDDEHRVDRLHEARRHRPAEDRPVEPLVGVHGDDGALLLEQRPEDRARDKHRDERDNAAALVGGDLVRREDHGEQRGGGDDRDADDDGREPAGRDDSGHREHDHEQHHDQRGGTVADPPAPVERVGDGVADVPEGAVAEQKVLRQAEGHPHRSQAEPPVEALHALQQAGEQRAEQGAEVHAHVVDREAGVAAGVLG